MASKRILKNAQAILGSFDLSFTTHSGQFQSRDTIPLIVFPRWHFIKNLNLSGTSKISSIVTAGQNDTVSPKHIKQNLNKKGAISSS
jgi:hypothetical protein